MDELKQIDKKVEIETRLKEYMGNDRVVLAEEKRKEIIEENKVEVPFRGMTGFTFFDECTKGLRKGQMIVLSGPPKNGKTQICQTFTKKFVETGNKVMWFSYELGYEELFEKFPMDSLDFYVPNYLNSGNLDWIEERVIEAKLKHGLDYVFIDHLDFLRDPNVLKGVSFNLSSYIGGLVQKVKSMAVRHNVVIFLMCHITKSKWTTNQLPTSEQIRDTGQITQLADIVLMMIRNRKDGNYFENFATLGIMENRKTGKTGNINMKLVNELFVPLESDTDIKLLKSCYDSDKSRAQADFDGF